MKKYKVCVYAICLNEEKFVKRWVDSMKEADEIYVLDTGSNDHTVDILKELGVHVTIKKIEPWRFDDARNASLALVPADTDICVCTDLDEVFEPGWRIELESVWKETTTRARYNYNWSFDPYGNPAVNFYVEKIHKRLGYHWTHPVHEVLISETEEEILTTDAITLNHYPDSEKSRSSYLPLLELSVKEDPEDDRNTHYLGREYMYYQRYEDAIHMLKRHLELPKALWKDERSASMRFIGRCYLNLKDEKNAENWYQKAITETPYLRDPLVEVGFLYYQQNAYQKAIDTFLKALKIPKNGKSYINEPFCYNGTIEDALSICYFELGDIKMALYYVKEALKYQPDNKRILGNLGLIQRKMKQN